MRVVIIAPTPMMQAGLQTLLSTPDVYIAGAASGVEMMLENAQTADVVVVADDAQVQEIVQALPQAQSGAIVVFDG